MIEAYLAIVIAATAASHPPQILAPFESINHCLKVRETMSRQYAKELDASGASVVCLELRVGAQS